MKKIHFLEGGKKDKNLFPIKYKYLITWDENKKNIDSDF